MHPTRDESHRRTDHDVGHAYNRPPSQAVQTHLAGHPDCRQAAIVIVAAQYVNVLSSTKMVDNFVENP